MIFDIENTILKEFGKGNNSLRKIKPFTL